MLYSPVRSPAEVMVPTKSTVTSGKPATVPTPLAFIVAAAPLGRRGCPGVDGSGHIYPICKRSAANGDVFPVHVCGEVLLFSQQHIRFVTARVGMDPGSRGVNATLVHGGRGCRL